MRTYYWYLTAYLRKHGLILFLSVVVAVVFFSFFIPVIASNIENKKHTYVGLVGDYSLDNLPTTVQHQLSAGLTSLLPDGSVAPEVAERWTVENDGKTYRFLIKKNITWQNGDPFTPEDIQYSFRDVEILTTPNDIVFKLPDPFAPFPTIVTQAILRIETRPYFIFFKRPFVVGLGKYRLTNYKRKGQRLTQLTLESTQEKITYRFYLTEDDAVLGFKRGEVDVLPGLSAGYDIGSWPTVHVTKTLNQNRYLAIFFNNSDPLFPKEIRQALSYAIQKPANDVRAVGPISPNSWAYLEGGKTYDYDLDRAVERALANIPPEPLQFDLTTTSTFQQEAESIKQQWESFGQRAVAACQGNKDVEDKNKCNNLQIAVNVRINNFPDTSNFKVLLIGQESPPDPDQYFLWHSGQSTNFTQYQNTRIDSLLEKGRQTQDQKERLAIYQEFQQFFLEDAPAVFLRYLDSYEIKRK